MDTQRFSDWLNDQMRDRGWTQADLARASGLNTGFVSMIMSGKRGPGSKACQSIAKGLRLHESVVFQAAGLLAGRPRTSDGDALINEITDIYHRLDEYDRAEMLEFSRMKLRLQEAKGKYGTHPAPAESP